MNMMAMTLSPGRVRHIYATVFGIYGGTTGLPVSLLFTYRLISCSLTGQEVHQPIADMLVVLKSEMKETRISLKFALKLHGVVERASCRKE